MRLLKSHCNYGIIFFFIFIILEVNNERSEIQNNEMPITDKWWWYFQNLHYTILTEKKTDLMIMKSGFHFHHHETWYQKRTRSHVNRVFLAPYGEFNHTKPCQKIVLQNTPWVNGKTCGNCSNLVSRYNDLKPIWNISTQNSNLWHSNRCSQKNTCIQSPKQRIQGMALQLTSIQELQAYLQHRWHTTAKSIEFKYGNILYSFLKCFPNNMEIQTFNLHI